MSTSLSRCLPFCVRLILSYYSLFSSRRNKYDDDDDDDDDYTDIHKAHKFSNGTESEALKYCLQ